MRLIELSFRRHKKRQLEQISESQGSIQHYCSCVCREIKSEEKNRDHSLASTRPHKYCHQCVLFVERSTSM